MHRTIGALIALAAVTAAISGLLAYRQGPGAATASSHRESPLLAFDSQADNTDIYFFVSPDRPDTATLIANYIPSQGPGSAPEYYRFGDDVLYEMHLDNDGDAEEDIIYQFRFTTTITNPNTFLYVSGPVTSIDDSDLVIKQTYSVTRVDVGGVTTVLATSLPAAPAYVGTKSFPDYDAVAAQAFAPLPGGPGKAAGARVFAGPREEGFFVNVGGAFDLLDVTTNPKDELAGLNVSSIVLQVPIEDITSSGARPTATADPAAVIGYWATASRQTTTTRVAGGESDAGSYVQVSRLGNPLVNELVMPRTVKDRFNAAHPRDDAQFLQYVLAPELATLLNVVLGFPAPTSNRTDLVTVFLTGVPGLTQPPNGKPAEMMRLNTAVPPSASPNRLGVLGGDNAGYPNGRRPGDDVTDISLAAVGGALQMVPGAAMLTDNVNANDKAYLPTFPYLASPYPGHR